MMQDIRMVIYKDNQVIEVVDNRTLEGEKARRIEAVKTQAGETILAAYPMYKQQNAALGLYSEEQAQAIKDGIQALRDDANTKEAAINACETLAELDGLYL